MSNQPDWNAGCAERCLSGVGGAWENSTAEKQHGRSHSTSYTLRYEVTHGHKPRQPHGASVSPWAFLIDQAPEPVVITASYKDALKKAKSRARWAVVVLP